MTVSTLKIDIQDGRWTVDIFSQGQDSGQYELIYPQREAQVELSENNMYGFNYSISAPKGTRYAIYLDEKRLIEGEVNESQVARGNSVI
ncbi:hypothetical protein [Alteromonas sp. ASW11-130]|uniref:hypothetical protein n=1 Tax=Alteromonas sp. ASW11-130 TaxID=3015775 RepID=UPI002242ACA0|nr:hypothetical protein [Alteromonas sp. ASW11-130]MCW8091791.1 hypothetical protein [Alteromonas sp. ASW11-130]